MAAKKSFLDMPAPENYVAGLGRGATGFTTRSDLGPAREGPSEEQMKEMLAKRAAQLGKEAPSAYGAVEKKEEDDDEERFQDPENETGLFSSGMNYDKEDDEADRIYQEIDEKMEKRRRVHREAREQKEREDYEKANPKIQQQFADLKRSLGSVTEEEWAALPEVGDMTGRSKRAREARMAERRFYAVPDSVLAGAAQAGQLETSISTDADGTMTNFASIGAAQKSALQVRLDSAASGVQTSAGGTSTSVQSVDPLGYMTALDKAQANGAEVPVEDINRARLLLESAVNTNLTNGPAHVALCRLEELAGKLSKAKKVIARGCQLCPHSISCWEENIRINKENLHNAKIIAASAIKLNPKAINLWQAAIDLEKTVEGRKKVARAALDHNPQSVELWKILINDTEDLRDVRMLFQSATETIKISEELWLSYARVCEPDAAQQVLNRARRALPTSAAIWIQGCRLQEQLGRGDAVEAVMERAVKALTKESAMLKRDDWIHRAEICEEEGALYTCVAIIKATADYGLADDTERKETWLEESKNSAARGKIATARAIMQHAIKSLPQSQTVWKAAIDLEKRHGTTEQLLDMLDRSVNACPGSEEFWLMYARELRAAGDVDKAREVTRNAMTQLGGNENLYINSVNLEIAGGSYDTARRYLAVGRETAPTDRIYVKSAVLERETGNLEDAIDLCNQGLQLWPSNWKLYAIKGQIYESSSKLKEAEQVFSIGTRAISTKKDPSAVQLFLLLSRLQEKQGLITKARSTLDRAKQQNPKNDLLLCEAVRLELRAGNKPAAQKLMAAAMQQCPRSGLLWSERIMKLEDRTHRRQRILEAMKQEQNDPRIFLTAARIFWGERKFDKANNWFTKAIVLDPDFGDTWIYYYMYLEDHGTEEKKNEVLSRVVQAEPKHGEIWQSVSKDPHNSGKDYEELLKLGVAKLREIS